MPDNHMLKVNQVFFPWISNGY
uniref:Uncharacterized protein n=1 Tax=Rhizophora mucronata TaxID=61149 RepID=A0A2P2N4H4_RHIMU